MERVCIYPGSFDPVTVGHMDIIRRARRLFDRVVVAVLHNPAKTGCFPVAERLDMLQCACRDMDGVSVAAFDGLLVDFAHQEGACAVVRGIRAIGDYEAEKTMADINARLMPEMETVFLTTRPELACVSSSAVRELAAFGGDFAFMVPEGCAERVARRFAKAIPHK